jgi:hypothetical protein
MMTSFPALFFQRCAKVLPRAVNIRPYCRAKVRKPPTAAGTTTATAETVHLTKALVAVNDFAYIF